MDKSIIYGDHEPSSKRIVNLSSDYFIVKQDDKDVKVPSHESIKKLEQIIQNMNQRINKLESELKKVKADNDHMRQYINKHNQNFSEMRYD